MLPLVKGRLLRCDELTDLVKDATTVAIKGACLLKSSQGYFSDMRVAFHQEAMQQNDANRAGISPTLVDFGVTVTCSPHGITATGTASD